jgi:exodeoxyribonuclease VII small subunit
MVAKKNLKEEILKMSFEAAMTRLEEIVETLSKKKINLDQMIELYQEGDLLKQHCVTRLGEAKMKIDVVEN